VARFLVLSLEITFFAAKSCGCFGGKLKEMCALEYIEALYNDEISIHWA
jgi:hypothetical protein